MFLVRGTDSKYAAQFYYGYKDYLRYRPSYNRRLRLVSYLNSDTRYSESPL